MLNSTLSYIWQALDDFTQIGAFSEHLAATFLIPVEQAQSDLLQTLAALEKEGLLEGTFPSQPDILKSHSLLTPSGEAPPSNIISNYHCTVLLGDAIILLESNEQAIVDEIAAIYPIAKQASNRLKEWQLTILRSGGGGDYDIYLNTKRLFEGVSSNSALPIVVSILFQAATDSLKNKILFHAAVVKKDGVAIMLPANSGSGKSTLTAGLVSDGWDFLTDELAVIDVSSNKVDGVPFPVSVKSGAVSILTPHFPNLSELTTHHRPDDKKVKYLKIDYAGSYKGENISAIIFPQYKPGIITELLPIDKVTALQLLSKTGSSERSLSIEDVRAMVAIVEKTPCYQLLNSDLAQAVQEINNLALNNS